MMARLDFKEIPDAGKATGQQDAFELFARELLTFLGFKILQGPSRGADIGKDLIVEEARVGIIESTKFRWLVSCKHFAHSGKSVRPDDEKNILERVSAASCDGFLGFYSTLPSAGLSELLHRQSKIAARFLDHEEIERHLVASTEGRRLATRYFPNSANKLKHTPARICEDNRPLACEYCGKNLLDPPSGIWVLWHTKRDENGKQRYVDFYCACKMECDRVMKTRVRNRQHSDQFVYDDWDDIPDMSNPVVFIHKIMAIINGLATGDEFEPEVLDRLKDLLFATFPLVSRHLSDEDREDSKRLQMIPSYLGGLG